MTSWNPLISSILEKVKMKLIVCLGNPGKEYEKNRHNIGFRVGDELIRYFKFQSKGNKFKSVFFEGKIGNETILLIKPQTFMNLSGDALVAAFHFYKLSFDDILVIYDDIDIPFGQIRLKPKGSAGTHNGMRSILEQLQSSEFSRLRMGIGPLPDRWDLSRYVLSNFTQAEESEIPDLCQKAVSAIDLMLHTNISNAMCHYN